MYLKSGRERSVNQRHPWIFSGAIERVEGDAETGSTVEVRSASGEALAKAAFSPQSKIQGRVWSFDPHERIDRAFFRQKLVNVLERRNTLLAGNTNAVRLVHAESDGLPGLIVDRYADWLVVQVLSAGVELWHDTLVDVLVELTGVKQVFERSDVEVRRLEGLAERKGLLRGENMPEQIEIVENGLRFWVDLERGQKTGFYIDQRPNRQKLREMAAGKRILNCFSYTGGFTVYALAGGAREVISVDSSAEALEMGRRNVALNGMDVTAGEWIDGDVFQKLRLMRDQAQKFDMIVLDPPKFAPTAAHAEKAARAYKDINLLGFKLLNPGGVLFTFSCSGGISPDLFQKIVASAALDARVDASIIGYLHQGADHPVALNFPEGEYLKGLVCQLT
ncbi:MAG TPA: class I SAM-dependent rRNA methyltransferase [Anaerolineaceae bacterium]|nr:class I SAM-dependent rRNA methyltransferase [Anaerolineaceae bacterium]